MRTDLKSSLHIIDDSKMKWATLWQTWAKIRRFRNCYSSGSDQTKYWILQKNIPEKGCFRTLERYFGIPLAPSKAIGMERRDRCHFQGFSIAHFMGPILAKKEGI